MTFSRIALLSIFACGITLPAAAEELDSNCLIIFSDGQLARCQIGKSGDMSIVIAEPPLPGEEFITTDIPGTEPWQMPVIVPLEICVTVEDCD